MDRFSTQPRLEKLKKLFIASRPWSFSASITGALLGFTLAWKDTGSIDFIQALLAMITILSIHCAGNLVNTYYDFANGFDTEFSDDKTLVRKELNPSDIATCIAECYFVGSLSFIAVCLRADVNSVIMVALFSGGVFSSFIYTGGIGLKYVAFGDVLIFLTFGLLTAMFAYFAEAGEVPVKLLAYALPLAFSMEAILHGNNTRDIEGDRKAGAVTLAILLGKKYACVLYFVLLMIPYVLLSILALGYSWALLLPFVTVPMALRLSRDCFHGNLEMIPQKSAQLNLLFGLLYLAGLLIAP